MTQLPLFFFCYLLGLAFALAFGPRRRPTLCCALAFPVGLTLAVAGVLLLLVLGIPYRAEVVEPLWGALFAGLAFLAIARTRPDRRSLLVILVWSAAFAGLALLAVKLNMTVMSYASHKLVAGGKAVSHYGAVPDWLWKRLDPWGAFPIVVHSLSGIAGVDYVYAFTPLLWVSFVALFAVALASALRLRGLSAGAAVGVAALGSALLASTWFFTYQLAYLHVDLAAACYLFAAFALLWLAEVEQDGSYLALVLLCLGGFGLQHTDTASMTVPLLALFVGQSRLPRRAWSAPLIAFVFAAVLWLAKLEATATFGRLGRGSLVALGSVFLLWLVAGRVPSRARRIAVPAAIAAATAAALAWAFYSRPDHMLQVVGVMSDHLLSTDSTRFWGRIWAGLLLLAGAGLLAPAPPARSAFVFGIPIYLAGILLVGYGLESYSASPHAHGNRMMVHVLPLAVFYLSLKLGPLAVRDRAPVPQKEPSAEEGDAGVFGLFGGKRRLAALLGCAALLLLLLYNIHLHARYQREMPPKYRIEVHNSFEVEQASEEAKREQP